MLIFFQLNFRDCRAKIRQVDSHNTLANGLVVQVFQALQYFGGCLGISSFALSLKGSLLQGPFWNVHEVEMKHHMVL